MSMFEVGDVVVCVDATFGRLRPPTDLLVRRALYRIEAVIPDDYEGPGLSLTGMNASPYEGYSASRFRKLLKADEQFTARIKACRPAHRKTPVSA